MILLISNKNIAVAADKSAVNAPRTMIRTLTFGLNSNKNEVRINKKTPAVTIVAAWIKAETGVGPSIAAGNQVCRPSCADLPITPTTKKKQIKSWIAKSVKKAD